MLRLIFFGGLTFDFFFNTRKIFRNENPRPMDYSAGAGNGPFGVNTEMCVFGGFPPFSPVLWLAAWGGKDFFQKKKKSSGCRRILRHQRIARQGQDTMFLLIQVHFCFIKPPQQQRRFAAVAKKRHLPPADRMPRSTKAPHALTIAFAAFSVSSPWAHATHTTCIQRNFDVCAPALSSQPAHTTRHNFGYTNSHTATKILACGSW